MVWYTTSLITTTVVVVCHGGRAVLDHLFILILCGTSGASIPVLPMNPSGILAILAVHNYMNDRNFESLYWLVIFVSPLFATGEAGITGAWHSSKPYLFAPCLPRLRVRHHIHDTITTRPAWFVLGKPSVPWSIHPRLPYTSAKSSWGTVFRAACFLHLCSRCTRGRSYR